MKDVCITPPAIFKNVFDKCNFSIISSHFDSNKSYALSTHKRQCANKMHHHGEALGIRGKSFKQNLPENCSKRAKMTVHNI